jgi:hypothetical protein
MPHPTQPAAADEVWTEDERELASLVDPFAFDAQWIGSRPPHIERQNVALIRARRILSLGYGTPAAVREMRAREGCGWQPIETAPRDGTPILVSFGSMGVHQVSWTEPSAHDWKIWCVDDNKHGPFALRGYSDDGPTAPTKWMPLPATEPPAATAEGG